MNPKTKELWVIPTVIALATGIPLAAGFMFLSLWLAGTPITASFSLEWIKVALTTSLPMWVTLAVLAVATIITGMFFRQRAKTAEETAQRVSATHSLESTENRIAKLNEEHAAEIAKLKAKEPRLHGVWNQSQALWHMGRQGEAPAMQIGGWIDLTSSNTKEVMFLLAGYIGERRSQMFMDVEVKPNVVNRCMVMLFMVPPLETDATKPYDATIVVEDQYNRKFSLPLQRFRPTPGQTPFPTSVPGKPAPKLHVSWRGGSGWCWAQHEGERVLRISGDGPILLENVQEKVIITGVVIEGAEFVGVFDNFELSPGEPTFRGMNLDFKGINPVDKEPVTVKLTFVDLRGNKYPTNETTFKPLSLPNQYGGLPWPQ
jgi:membrane protein implicated in regulation of membrane protease activity